MIFRIVDLPVPEGPMMPTASPRLGVEVGDSEAHAYVLQVWRFRGRERRAEEVMVLTHRILKVAPSSTTFDPKRCTFGCGAREAVSRANHLIG